MVISDAGTLSQIASIIAGFGATMLTFRVQRHLETLSHETQEHSWLPIADWLLVIATALSIALVILPLLTIDLGPNPKLPRAACAASSVLLFGYIFAILAHYRLIFGGRKPYDVYPVRRETALAEAIIAIASLILAVAASVFAYWQ